ncbi:MAG: TonB-dependent receptor [Pseudomonadales bacterium]
MKVSKQLVRPFAFGLPFFLATPGVQSAPLTLEEVIVTAQKRQESLQNVNLAVTAVAGLALEEGLIDTVEDLQAIVPSLSAGDDFAFAKIFIRGIGLNSSFPGVDPSVALHVDGAVVSLSYAQLGSFFDLERVEVLRGPQGTLYGRNATGGSINLITRKPTEELEGYSRVTVGSDDLLRLEGGIGGPVSDSVRGRIAYKSTDRDGYGKNEFTGNDIDDADKQSIRGHLQFDFSDDVSLLLSAEQHQEDDAGLGLKLVETLNAIDPQFPAAPGEGGFAQQDRRNIASEADNQNIRDTWSITANLDWRLNEHWRLQSLTNYRDADILLVQDLDWSSNINDDLQSNRTTSEHVSEELQLHFDYDKLHGLVALYYFDEDFRNDNNIGFVRPQDGTTTFLLFTGDVNIESTALFANVTYDFTDTFSINLGGRYTDEERSGVTSRFIRLSVFGNTDVDVTFTDDEGFTDFSPSIGLEWKPNDDLLAYFTYSEGFKGGAFQGGQTVPILEPETIENFDLGLKGVFLDGKLQLNLAAFFYEVTDMQLDRTRGNPDGSFVAIFENAASAEGQGLEAEASWLITEQFRLSGNVAFLDTEFTDYETDNPLDFGVNLQSLEGNKLRQSPEFSGYIRGEYAFDLANGGSMTFGAEASYKDEQFYTEFNDDISAADSYTLVNLNLKYTSPGEKVSINVWGKNVTDEDVRGGAFVSATGVTVNDTLLPPATYGVTFGYEF